MANKYTYRVTWSEEDQEYVGLCAEFPSLSWLAESQIEAFQGINDVVEDVLNDMRESGEQIPEPFSVKKYSGNFQVRIVPDQHRALSIQAAEDGVSLNRLVSNKLACA
jgi:predicted HicB family RNase H-like nuclease